MTVSLHQRRVEYEYHRETAGMTVEEFERACGLPPFSIVPAARRAKGPGTDGWLMYEPDTRAAALAEEDRQMTCLRALGVPLKQVAALYDCHFSRVNKRVDGHVLDPGQRAAFRDVRAEENRQMVCLRRLGLSLKAVGAQFGCTGMNAWRRTRGLP